MRISDADLLKFAEDFHNKTPTCTACEGTGKLKIEICHVCKGAGFIVSVIHPDVYVDLIEQYLKLKFEKELNKKDFKKMLEQIKKI